MSIDDIVDRIGIHDIGALFVDHLALVVHHIVVFDDLLAHVVIARFDLLLRGLDGFGEPASMPASPRRRRGWNRIIRENSVSGTENPQQIVFEAQVEARQAGIALTTRAAAQLVVDAAAFVALGRPARTARRRRAPGCLSAARLWALDPLDGGVAFRRLPPCPSSSSSTRNSRLPPSLMSVPRPAILVAIVTAREPPGLRHNMRFHLVEPGVEDVVLDAFLGEDIPRAVRTSTIDTVPTSTGWPSSCCCNLMRLGNARRIYRAMFL